MFKWLAKKLIKHLRLHFISLIKESIIELDDSKHYILFLSRETAQDEKELNKLFGSFAGKTNLVVLLVDHFHLLEI